MNRHDLIAPAIAIGAIVLHFSEQRSRQADIDRLRADLTTMSRRLRDLAEAAEEAHTPAAPGWPTRTPAAPSPTATARAKPQPDNGARSQAAERDAPSTPKAAPGAPADPPTPEASASASASAMAQITSYRDKFEDKFSNERPDPGWAAGAESTLKQKIAATLPEGSKVDAIECHASMCRIETTHENMDRFRQFTTGAFMDPKNKVWNGEFFTSPLGDPPKDGEKLTTVTYVAREGQDLPRFDKPPQQPQP
jgi:hypothetical protein